MSPEFQTELFKRYPEIFQDILKKREEDPNYLGIECDDGWFTIIDSFCYLMWDMTSRMREFDIPPVLIATQVKEKFGVVKFYFRLKFPDKYNGNESSFRFFVNGATMMLESISQRTCELTGKPGTYCKKGELVKTLCKEEAEKLDFQYDCAKWNRFAVPEVKKSNESN